MHHESVEAMKKAHIASGQMQLIRSDWTLLQDVWLKIIYFEIKFYTEGRKEDFYSTSTVRHRILSIYEAIHQS